MKLKGYCDISQFLTIRGQHGASVPPFNFATARVPVRFSYQWRLHLRRLVADDSLPVSRRDTFSITRNPTKRNVMCSSRAIKLDKQLLYLFLLTFLQNSLSKYPLLLHRNVQALHKFANKGETN